MLNLSGGSHLLFMDFFLTCILKNRSLPLHLQLKEEELQIFRKHSILDMLNLSGGSHLLFMDFFLTCILKNRSLPLHLQLKEEELQIFRKHSELFSQDLSGGSHLLFMDFFLTCILKNRSLPLHLQLKEEELQIFRKHSELFSQAPQLLAPLFQIYQSNLFVYLLLLLCDNWIRPALSSREPSLSRELRILQLIYKNIQLPVSQIIQWIICSSCFATIGSVPHFLPENRLSPGNCVFYS